MERIKRIEEMEKILNTHSEIVKEFNIALEKFLESQKNYDKLKEYYASDTYMSDFEASEKGELPKDLKCGVLSEDAVYNLIGDNFHTAIKMIETGTEIIKKH